ncbi:MAG: AraC family ligand binding domain-containing protein [Clostridia bacterium]|nr:AraC family ligand binding domain-containing protein [Clostridia bacterium]
MQSIGYVRDEEHLSFRPLYYGHESCRPGHSYGPNIRGNYLIHYVVSGCGTFHTNGKVYNVNPGEIFVIPPGEEIFYCADDKNPWTYIWIGFECNEKLQLADVIPCPEAGEIFSGIQRSNRMKNGRTAYLKARLWDLFAILIDSENYTTKYIDEALKMIHSGYAKELTVNDIAQELNLNRTYFSVLFKEKVGLTPKQYITNYRMDTAASLLSMYGKSVSVVAKSVGYPDLFTFSRMFKKRFGISPSKYVQTTTKRKRVFEEVLTKENNKIETYRLEEEF